jgi:hypothetical protein
MRTTWLALSGLLIAAPLAAQQTPAQSDSVAEQARRRIEAMLGLPRRAEEIRRTGVADSALRTILGTLAKERVPAEEVAVILEAEREAAAEHGPTDNFGAFVQAQLAAGKRGRELAAAIRAEHQARGKGRPADAGRGRGTPNDRDDDDETERASRGKRPENPGKRPENPGASKRPH